MQSRLQNRMFPRIRPAIIVERLDRATGIFDITQIDRGSQGHLGLLRSKLRLFPFKKSILALRDFLKDLTFAGDLVRWLFRS